MVTSDGSLNSSSPAARGALVPRRRLLAALLFLIPLGTSLLTALVAAEGDEPPPQPQATTPSIRDVEVTIRAREALGKDRELAPLNLGVKVRRGEATLWGPVPSAALIRRATQVLENVRGVYKVRSELYIVMPPPGPLVLPLPEPPTLTESSSPDRVVSRLNDLPGRTAEAPRAHVTLRGPVEAVPPPQTDPPPTRQPDPPPVESLAKAVERLRQSDLRFVSIKTEVRGGTVIVRGGTVRGEYVTAFAQAVAKLPGVDQVEVASGR
jgi:osmotically-inducible protein OsmY